MKKYINKFYAAAILAGLSFTACKPEIESVTPSAGEADFSRYVALGNSLTSGYANSSLYLEGQQVAYPNLIADQLKTFVNGGDFNQPYVKSGVDLGIPEPGFPYTKLPGRLRLRPVTDCNGIVSLSPVSTPFDSIKVDNLQDINRLFSIVSPSKTGPYNNLGAPLARSIDLLRPGYGNPEPTSTLPIRLLNGQSNIFYVRMMLSDVSVTDKSISLIDNAVKQNPTFFSLWIGNNDVLGYAAAGGDNVGTPITPLSRFESALDSSVNALTANGAKGVLATIPYVTSSPFFTSVPYNGLVLQRQGQVDSLNGAYALASAQIGIDLKLVFKLGQNPFVVIDELTTLPRFIKPDERILITSLNNIRCNKYGSAVPLPAEDYLSSSELSKIKDAVDGYNAKIRAVATEKNLAIADANAYLQSVQSGVFLNSVNYTNTFVSGGLFSLDGLHLTPKGNAVTANLFIDAINRKYNSKIPAVDINKYSGVLFP